MKTIFPLSPLAGVREDSVSLNVGLLKPCLRSVILVALEIEQ